MDNTIKTAILAVAVVVCFAGGFLIGENISQPTVGGLIHNVQESFDAGIAVDGTERISGTGGASFTTGSFSSTLSVSDDTTVAGLVKVSEASSTVQIGDTTSGVGEGCLILGDSGGATSSPVYVTATGNTLSATTVQPTICQ